MTKVGRNAPCPCGSGKKYKHCCLPKEDHHLVSQPDPFGQADPFDLPGYDPALAPPLNLPESLDPRARERDERIVMQLAGRDKFQTDEQYQAFLDFLRASPVLPTAAEPTTPLERAQDKMYDAFGAVGDRRAELAREALAISPDCADAYVLLAEETDVAEEALPLYEQGVAAAERTLGPDFRKQYAGRFWIDLDTRPYMRARYGRADVLSHLGRLDEAIAIAEDLIELNPIDDQGVNYFLLNQLLIVGRDEEAAQIVEAEAYTEDPSTLWRFGAALVKFRTLGDGVFARRALLDANAVNPLVIPYLLGDKKVPKRPPADFGSLIDEYDAIAYTSSMTDAWQNTPNVLDWMRRVVKEDNFLPPDLAARKTGPRFYLNIADTLDARHCPECDGRTRKQHQFLAVAIEPAWFLVAKLPGHVCADCGLLTVDEVEIDVVADRASQSIAPADAGNPYIVLGVLPDEAMRGREAGVVERDWLAANVEVFLEHVALDDDWDLDLGFDPASNASQDLLGPVMLIPPGRP